MILQASVAFIGLVIKFEPFLPDDVQKAFDVSFK